MHKNLSEAQTIKPVFSGHETFPLRYGWLKKVYDEVKHAESLGLDAKDIFNDPESISSFGVGKNMVASMRHWASYTGVLKDNRVTGLAEEILSEQGLDPWMEHPTTLWLLHWYLVKQRSLITYHWFFNYYNGTAFDRKFLNEEILELCKLEGWKLPSLTTLKRDVECFIRMYVGKDLSTSGYDDDSIESPLAELSLIKSVNRQGFFAPNRGVKPHLSTGVFLLALAHFWRDEYGAASSLSLEGLLYDPCSPGRIFLLDESSVLSYVYSTADKASALVNWSETAGMRQFTRNADVSIEDIISFAKELIRKEYQE